MVWQLGHGDLKPGLDGSHHLLVAFRGDEGDSETFGAETAGTTAQLS